MRQPRPRPTVEELRLARAAYETTLSAKLDASAMLTGASAMDRLMLDVATRRAEAEHDTAMRKLNGLVLKRLEADVLDEEDRRAEEAERQRIIDAEEKAAYDKAAKLLSEGAKPRKGKPSAP